MSILLCFVADMGGQNPVNFAKLAAASWNGIRCNGVIHRATRSNASTDPAYAGRKELAEAAGLLWGAYAFNTGESAATQASRLLSVAKPDATTSRGLDLETNPRGAQLSLPSG